MGRRFQGLGNFACGPGPALVGLALAQAGLGRAVGPWEIGGAEDNGCLAEMRLAFGRLAGEWMDFMDRVDRMNGRGSFAPGGAWGIRLGIYPAMNRGANSNELSR
jgi:hypothetical protein